LPWATFDFAAPWAGSEPRRLGDMTRIVLLVMGVVLILMGVLWTMQGLDIVGGSAMSGNALWAVIGPIVVVVGAVLLFRGLRTQPPQRDL
jgi:uncharacterized membrane protein